MPRVNYVYKIQDNKTGLFSTGGCTPSFTKTGKCWSSRGALKAHLTQFVTTSIDSYVNGLWVREFHKVPESWDVIRYVVSTEIDDVFSAKSEAERPAKK